MAIVLSEMGNLGEGQLFIWGKGLSGCCLCELSLRYPIEIQADISSRKLKT